MSIKNVKRAAHMRRKKSIRKRIAGTGERPRLSVFRSCEHIYAQVIDDTSGSTLVSASTQSAEIKGESSGKRKAELATLVGQLVARKCLEQRIEAVVFDRNGFIYHGRVKAVAEGAREGGLRF